MGQSSNHQPTWPVFISQLVTNQPVLLAINMLLKLWPGNFSHSTLAGLLISISHDQPIPLQAVQVGIMGGSQEPWSQWLNWRHIPPVCKRPLPSQMRRYSHDFTDLCSSGTSTNKQQVLDLICKQIRLGAQYWLQKPEISYLIALRSSNGGPDWHMAKSSEVRGVQIHTSPPTS